MLDSLEKYHGVDIHTVNSASRRWDRIMAYFECCGVNSYKDFRGLEYWPPTKIRGRTVILQTPIVCCKGPVNDLTCASKGRAHPRNNNMIKGCYNVIFNKFFYNRMTVGLIVLLIMFQSVVLFCCSWILCYMSRRNSY
ncbi:hypothetical protein EGW08_019927 [Elysia chlorotica]|uniref:Tetraspanin n=1 Tax=Elysia chlorotica TaxID=188477 RepID=A0A433ST43_ELYCH|nr:hypothetical protein EGW08_019927 [Elysia chlorotica]